jgi:hypothetical protein
MEEMQAVFDDMEVDPRVQDLLKGLPVGQAEGQPREA